MVPLLALLAGACGGDDAAPPPDSEAPAMSSRTRAPTHVAEVVRRLPHDRTAYTQGLVFHEGNLYESGGRYGESAIRVIEPASGAVLRKVDLPRTAFAEGIATTGTDLVVLTWKELVAYFLDPATLEVRRTASYKGEGWGLCFDGTHFWMTSGGDQLVQRDPETFEPLSSVTITAAGERIRGANELECDGDHVWANVYQTTRVIRIDKRSGEVLEEVELAGVVPPGVDVSDPDYVANGIAYDRVAGTFFVTGKLWPELLEVRFVPAPPAP
jgi:glutamine cyclotransferase